MTDDAPGGLPPRSQHEIWMANISHEIRTPLLTVKGFPELIVLFANDPLKVTEYAGFIEQGAGRTLDLVNAMLGLFKDKPDGVTLADLNTCLSKVAFRPGYDGSSAYPKEAPKGPQGTTGQ